MNPGRGRCVLEDDDDSEESSVEIDQTAQSDRTAGVDRRTVLAGAGVGIAALAVAGCSSGGTSSASPQTAPAARATGGGAVSVKPVTSLDKVPVGQSVSAEGPGGEKLLVAQPTAGTVVAFSAICTHMGCTVGPAGKELHCPCHGSVYDAATGKVLHGPAPRALAPFPVHVVDGQVLAGA